MAKAAPSSAAARVSAPWTNNNLACVYTWLDLTFILELNTTFDVSGDVPMDKLRFWNKDASSEGREIEAMNVAAQLAKMFTGLNFATYESGRNFATAVNEMKAVLIVRTKTIADLAVVVDENHNFFGEIKV